MIVVSRYVLITLITAFFALTPPAPHSSGEKATSSPPLKNPLLIPDSTGMETAWDYPHNPMTDSLLGSDPLSIQIRRGFRLFTQTTDESQFAVNGVSCSNCHLNGGQREKALPLVGVAGIFPEFNKRAGRLFNLEDRILECFKRSIDAGPGGDTEEQKNALTPTTDSKEVLAIAAYITWLSAGYPAGTKLPWRGQNSIPPDKQIPIAKLDRERGKSLFMERCTNCHGEDGQGVWIGDKKAGPLWGDSSWNDGAGAARVYTLAGMFMYAMPYINTNSLTYEEAQQIAMFIESQHRPEYPFKARDYPGMKPPIDAVYYLH